MQDEPKQLLGFNADDLRSKNFSPADCSIAINLFLRAACAERSLEGFKYWLKQAYRMAQVHGAISDPPSRCESIMLYRAQVLEFMHDNIFPIRSNTFPNELRSKHLLHSEVQNERVFYEPRHPSGIYEHTLRGLLEGNTFRFFLRFVRAKKSILFVENASTTDDMWLHAVKWWVLTNVYSNRVIGADRTNNILPIELVISSVRVKSEYRHVEGWIHSHLAAPTSGLPDVRLFDMLLRLTNFYERGENIDIFAALKELHSHLAPELEVYYGDDLERLMLGRGSKT